MASYREKQMTSLFLKFQMVYKLFFFVFLLLGSTMLLQYGVQIANEYTIKLEQENKLLEAELDGIYKVPDLESTLTNLEERINILNTEEIDGRLDRIEKTLEISDLKPEQVKSLSEIRNDYVKIKSYVFQNPDQIIEIKQLQRDYIQIKDRQEKFMEKEDIEREFNFNRILLTSTLGVFGVLVTIFGVSWFSMWKKNSSEDQSKKESSSVE